MTKTDPTKPKSLGKVALEMLDKVHASHKHAHSDAVVFGVGFIKVDRFGHAEYCPTKDVLKWAEGQRKE